MGFRLARLLVAFAAAVALMMLVPALASARANGDAGGSGGDKQGSQGPSDDQPGNGSGGDGSGGDQSDEFAPTVAQIQNLLLAVDAFSVAGAIKDPKIAVSLDGRLRAALGYLQGTDPNPDRAARALKSFVEQVRDERGEGITPSAADALIALARGRAVGTSFGVGVGSASSVATVAGGVPVIVSIPAGSTIARLEIRAPGQSDVLPLLPAGDLALAAVIVDAFDSAGRHVHMLPSAGSVAIGFQPPAEAAAGSERIATLDPGTGATQELATALRTNPAGLVLAVGQTAHLTPFRLHASRTVSRLSISATSLSFGNVVVGSGSPIKRVTLTNLGSRAVQLGTISVSVPFSLWAGLGGCNTSTNGISGGGILLAGGASCDAIINFNPTASGAATGTLDITGNGQPSSFSVALSGTGFPAVPVISSISPNSGSAGGGTAVTITGSHFIGATRVSFGSNLSSFTVTSDSSITAVSPVFLAGAVDLTVITPGGTSAVVPADVFTYQRVTPTISLASSANPAVYGQSVTLTVASVGYAGGPAISGPIHLTDGTTALATLTLGSSGSASVSLNTLGVGAHMITASYDGDNAYLPASVNLSETVSARPVAEYPIAIPADSGTGLAQDRAGNFWLTEYDGNKLAKFSPTTHTYAEFAVPFCCNPTTITLGPDGRMWFTERFADRIGAIDPTNGVFSSYATGVPGGQPYGIIPSSDGGLWFTLIGTNRIGKMTTAGVASTFSLPPGTGSSFVASAPDGSAWFTMYADSRIGHITTAGVLNYVTTPTMPNEGNGIAVDGMGNVWFDEWTANAVVEYTPSTAVFTTFAIPTPASGSYGLTVGSDGNIWFTENSAGKIARLDFSGAIFEFPIPSGPPSGPWWLMSGADGNLWFAERSGGIGEISPYP